MCGVQGLLTHVQTVARPAAVDLFLRVYMCLETSLVVVHCFAIVMWGVLLFLTNVWQAIALCFFRATTLVLVVASPSDGLVVALQGGYHHFGDSELLKVVRVLRTLFRRFFTERDVTHRRILQAADEHVKELEAIKKVRGLLRTN